MGMTRDAKSGRFKTRSPAYPDRYHNAAALPRRILLTSGSYHHIVDGVTLTLNRLVAHLEAHGIEVMVVAPTANPSPMEPTGRFCPVPSVTLPGRREYRVSTIIPPRLRREIARFRPDLIHVATPDFVGRWAMGYGRMRSIPVVATYHTDFMAYLGYYGLASLESTLLGYLRYFYRRCDIVCVPSRSMIDRLVDRGIDGRMRIWGRGVETDRFAPVHRSRTWRGGLGVDERVPVINFTGRLVLEKNVMALPDISRRLDNKGTPYRMVVVGEGPARARLEAAMPRAIFTGRLEAEALATAYASSDLFCFPSESETFGNVLLEAMASGLPSVAVAATGSADLVLENRTGFLTDPSDGADGLSSAVARLASNPDLRVRMSHAARAHAMSYRWETILDSMLAHYREASNIRPAVFRRRMMGLRPAGA